MKGFTITYCNMGNAEYKDISCSGLSEFSKMVLKESPIYIGFIVFKVTTSSNKFKSCAGLSYL